MDQRFEHIGCRMTLILPFLKKIHKSWRIVSWAYYHHHYYQHANDHQIFDEKHTIQRIAWLQSVAQRNTENSFISILLINWEVGSPKSTFFLAISYVSGCCIGILG